MEKIRGCRKGWNPQRPGLCVTSETSHHDRTGSPYWSAPHSGPCPDPLSPGGVRDMVPTTCAPSPITVELTAKCTEYCWQMNIPTVEASWSEWLTVLPLEKRLSFCPKKIWEKDQKIKMNKKFYPKGIEKSGVHALIQNDQRLKNTEKLNWKIDIQMPDYTDAETLNKKTRFLPVYFTF